MGQLVSELNRIVWRIVVIAPRRAELLKLFEEFGVSLKSELAPQADVKLAAAAVNEGALAAWSSFNLGKRAGLDVRITLMGYALEEAPPTDQVLELCEGVFCWLPSLTGEGGDRADRLLTLRPGPAAKLKPWAVAGLTPNDGERGDLRQLALNEWTLRNFPKRVMVAADPTRLLKEGLEWVLSF